MKKHLLKILLFIILIFVGWDSYSQTVTFSPDIANPGVRQFIVPPGVTSITVEAWGGGGRGGTRRSSNGNGATAGGGGGAYSRSVIAVTPGQVIDYYVGFGSITQSPGEDTWFVNQTTIMAKGGNSVVDGGEVGATGGLASAGFGAVKFNGGNGADILGSGNDLSGGGGGSSAGINANGGNAINTTIGATAPFGGGNGGDGRADSEGAGNGIDGFFPGGGGGGAKRTNSSQTDIQGGDGGNGQLRISYIALTSATGTDDQSVCEDDPIIETTYSLPPNSTVSVLNLPPGLSYNYDASAGTISITGIPTADGTYTINAIPPYNSFFTLTKSGTVTIILRPDVSNMTETICSGEDFSITPVDGVNGFVPVGTTYSWGPPIFFGGVTGGVAGSGSSISGNLTNTTKAVQIAIYTVTPTIDGCDGTNFTVAVTIDPIATINDLTTEVCNGEGFNLNPTNGTDGIVPSGTTYSWNVPSLPAGLSGGQSGSGNSNITGTLVNSTNTPLAATYTVTPNSGGCVGPDFTVTVTVNPEPNIDDLTATICSEETFDITPTDGDNGIVPAGTTYTWVLQSADAGIS
ncbi:PKD-like domain-containing protein, partial [Algoriphagus sp. SE2]|uniref:PKD-like domain-containing protein n=1 Tax=Algoriphagus sp. SE2 TaxID=3141536 RepID=UPI0031CD464E